jgi:hypothetical protein
MTYQSKQQPKAETAPTIAQRLDALYVRAAGFIATGRVDGLLRQWLKSPDDLRVQGHISLLVATTLALNTPSASGATAFDRMARAGGYSPEDAGLVAALRRAKYRIVQLTGGTCRDFATQEPLSLRPDKRIEPSQPVLCVVVPLPDGTVAIAGQPVTLDAAALEVARPFIRLGNAGLSNPLRCAELVYRHMLRLGVERPDAVPEPRPYQPKLPFRPDTDPVDALAADWAGRLSELTEQDFAKMRPHTGVIGLMNSLTFSGLARDAGRPSLADAYARAALVMIETFVLRHRYGSGGMTLDELAAEIARPVMERGISRRIVALFETLRGRLNIAPAAGRIADTDLDKLVQRIRGLRAKTVDQGCTEHEAMAAAAKVAELLDRHGLTLNELDLRRQTCEGVGIDTGRKRRGPIDSCMTVIAAFFDSRVWSEVSADDTIRYVFFGLPGDVDGALYLHDLVTQAFETETRTFRDGPIYRDAESGDRRTATNSFQIGLANGIRAKLDALRVERDAARRGSSGRDLVPVKQSILEHELEKLGLNFVRRGAPRPRRALADAYGAGKEAGARFEYRAGIEA